MITPQQVEAAHGQNGDRLPPAGVAPGFPPGTHLVTRRRGYLHHGIYVGGGRVVHYSGSSRSWRGGPVEEVSVEEFAGGRSMSIKPSVNARFSGTEIVRRARSRLGEDRYRLTSNNCEHFCEWCIHDRPRSEQVERWLDAMFPPFLRHLVPLGHRSKDDVVAEPADPCAA
jgi:hypothetical protein